MTNNGDSPDNDGCSPGVDTRLWLSLTRIFALTAIVVTWSICTTCLLADGAGA